MQRCRREKWRSCGSQLRASPANSCTKTSGGPPPAPSAGGGAPPPAEAVARWSGELDILVNNAGAIPGGDLLKVDEETWRRAWDLKVFGYINLTRQVYAAMKARGGGAIVNIIGSAGEKMNAPYVAGR